MLRPHKADPRSLEVINCLYARGSVLLKITLSEWNLKSVLIQPQGLVVTTRRN